MHNRITRKKEGRAPETPNEAPNDTVTDLLGRARMHLLSTNDQDKRTEPHALGPEQN